MVGRGGQKSDCPTNVVVLGCMSRAGTVVCVEPAKPEFAALYRPAWRRPPDPPRFPWLGRTSLRPNPTFPCLFPNVCKGFLRRQ